MGVAARLSPSEDPSSETADQRFGAECRVQLDPAVRDRLGLPVARLSGVAHQETMRVASFMLAKARQWLDAAGATLVWGSEPVARLSAGQHQAGTCRMGSDPATSVTDPWGRVWGHDNLFVSDGSLHPTNGGFNGTLRAPRRLSADTSRVLARYCDRVGSRI